MCGRDAGAHPHERRTAPLDLAALRRTSPPHPHGPPKGFACSDFRIRLRNDRSFADGAPSSKATPDPAIARRSLYARYHPSAPMQPPFVWQHNTLAWGPLAPRPTPSAIFRRLNEEEDAAVGGSHRKPGPDFPVRFIRFDRSRIRAFKSSVRVQPAGVHPLQFFPFSDKAHESPLPLALLYVLPAPFPPPHL